MYYEIVLDYDCNNSSREREERVNRFINRHDANGIGVIRGERWMLKLRFAGYGDMRKGDLENELGVEVVSMKLLDMEEQKTMHTLF